MKNTFCSKLLLVLIAFQLLALSSFCQSTYKEYMDAGYKKSNSWDYKGSISEYLMAVEVAPDSAEANYRLYEVFKLKGGHSSEVMFHINEAIRKDPNNRLYHSERAHLYSDSKQYEEAVADCRWLVRKTKMSALYLYMLAENLYRQDSTNAEAEDITLYVLKSKDRSEWGSEFEKWLPGLYNRAVKRLEAKTPVNFKPADKYGWMKAAPASGNAVVKTDAKAMDDLNSIITDAERGINSWGDYMRRRQEIVTRITNCSTTDCITKVYSSLQTNLQDLHDVLESNIVNAINAKKTSFGSCPKFSSALQKASKNIYDAAYKYSSASTLAKTMKDAYPSMKAAGHYENAVKILFDEYDEADVKTQNAIRDLYKTVDIYLNNECASMPLTKGQDKTNRLYDAFASVQESLQLKINNEDVLRAANLANRDKKAAASVSSTKEKEKEKEDDRCGACLGTGKKIKSCWACSGNGFIEKTLNVPAGSSTKEVTSYDRSNTNEAKLVTKKVTTTKYDTKVIKQKCSNCSGKGFTTTDYNCPVCKGTGKK